MIIALLFTVCDSLFQVLKYTFASNTLVMIMIEMFLFGARNLEEFVLSMPEYKIKLL